MGDQFKGLIPLLLVIAAVLALAFGNLVETAAIGAALIINAMIGFFTEFRAVRSMEALTKLNKVTAKVLREGGIQELSAADLVPGDVVVIDGGDLVTADLRLIEANKLEAGEAALTGESVPVSKALSALDESTPLAERYNMLFKGTSVTRGSGKGVVVAGGMDTELGRISSLVREAEEEKTPLEKRLDRLGRRLVWVTMAIGVLVAVTGLISGKETLLVIETAIALAVAAIPEGLPIVATLALARGMRRMARHNALVNRLSAIETLGSTNVIFTDKTGTLTENRMTVRRVILDSGEFNMIDADEGSQDAKSGDNALPNLAENTLLRGALEVGVLCNNASLARDPDDSDEEPVGDPLEIALLEAGARFGIFRDELLEKVPEVREDAFDSDSKMMATVHGGGEGYRTAVKGAPEPVVETCTRIRTEEGGREWGDEEREAWLEVNRRLAADGFRVLALAGKHGHREDDPPYRNLEFLGMVALLDPPRGEVPQAVSACRAAGIRVVMATGDQPETARYMAQAVGLVDGEPDEVVLGKELLSPEASSEEDRRRFLKASIFARVSPENKLELIELHQREGSVVAMTGDGVNDAPALKKADIGVAMGRRGTQSAKETADMVLLDDSFGTIVVAIEYGRAILNNIRKFILFLLSGNVGEILIVSLAWAADAPLPLLPLQILYLNMIGDVFPALALGVGGGEPGDKIRRPLSLKERILTRRHWGFICVHGLMIASTVLGAFSIALLPLGMTVPRAVTISFLTLSFSRLWHVFNMRDAGSNLLSNEITRNPFIWQALALCVALLSAAVYVPGLSEILHLVKPGVSGWLLILFMSLLPLIPAQILITFGLVDTRASSEDDTR